MHNTYTIYALHSELEGKVIVNVSGFCIIVILAYFHFVGSYLYI